jgi:hypothetical protein
MFQDGSPLSIPVDQIWGSIYGELPRRRYMKLLTCLTLAQVEYEEIEKACENRLGHRMSCWPRVSSVERPSESASESPEMHFAP